MIIAKNVKLKLMKKPEMEVPVLDEMMQIGDKFYRVKNRSLKMLNFMLNRKITEKCFETVKHMLDYNEDLLITMDDNVFNDEQMLVFEDKNGKYFNRVYFSKR